MRRREKKGTGRGAQYTEGKEDVIIIGIIMEEREKDKKGKIECTK